MGIRASTPLVHWNYFLALENDLERVARYIEFSENNFKTYSIELAHLLLAASSEVDVVLKGICKIIEPGKKHKNINDYRQVIQSDLKPMSSEKVFITRHGLELKPWSNWMDPKRERNPIWWKGYTDVKHHRDSEFEKAHLKNVLNAMGGLFVVVAHYYKLKFSLSGIDDFFLQVGSHRGFISLDDKYYPQLMAY